jgi:Tol biopolymer transport system component
MALTPGTRLGAYEIVARVGAGGMGEVYRARDTRLDRTVAIKILHPRPELQARFVREAKAIAALAHPHICTLFDIGREQDADFLVMEYLDGETLADRLTSGALSIARTLEIAAQIATALDAAHRAGIVHRDLKPANVMLTKEGAKLLDFGIAKQIAPDLDTVTMTGYVVGTLQYMAPEQLAGLEADVRTDIYALGAVLYEMVTGTKAAADAKPSGLVPSIPKPLDRLIAKSLATDPDDRWQTARDLASELKWIAETVNDAAATMVRANGHTSRWWIALAVAALAIAAVSAFLWRRPQPEQTEIRVQMASTGGSITEVALSPDGQSLAYVWVAEGASRLRLRRLDSGVERTLDGTEGAKNPFWSPDNRSIGFYARGRLKRIDTNGGSPVDLARAVGFGGSWNQDGVILFTPENSGPIFSISARGGAPTAVTTVTPPQLTAHRAAVFLPDGRHFLFLGMGDGPRGVYLGSLESKETRRLFDTSSTPIVAAPDHVLYTRQAELMSQRLSKSNWEPIGEPVRVAEHVVVNYDCGFCTIAAASAAGPLIYQATGAEHQLMWLDSSGQSPQTVGASDDALRVGFRMSPDRRTLAFAREAGEYQDLWLLGIGSGVMQRFTSDRANKVSPIWSPDGRHVTFAWDPTGILDLYEKGVDAEGNGTLLFASSEHKSPRDWTPDGQILLFESGSLTTGRDLWALPRAAGASPIAVAHTPFNERFGRFSPDGRWIVFQSNEAGRDEIYIQPFPGPRGRKQITNGGGTQPQWSDDGHDVLYVNARRSLASVPIVFKGATIEAGPSTEIFTTPEDAVVIRRDGHRFLVDKTVKAVPPLTLLLNWKPK